jgi:hypothetical protein
MDVNLIINNYTFIRQNNAINHIKKLLVYYMNYIKRNYSNSSIKLYKINYSFSGNKLIKIEIDLKNNIDKIINEIININYKIYDNTEKINNKNILDKIEEIKKNKNSKIFLITSMSTKYNNSEFYNDIENMEDIVYLNITNYENYIITNNKNIIHSHHRTSFHDLYKKDIFVPIDNYDVNKIDKKINNFKINDEINEKNLSEYIYLLELIDAKININIDEDIEDFYLVVKEILEKRININEIINNFIKNLQKNTILSIIERLSYYKKINIKSDETLLNINNIKLCVNFYQKNYSCNNYYLNSKKIRTENKNIILNKMNIPQINITNNNINKFTTSSLTLSNIYDEYNDSNIYGILINYKNISKGNINKFKNNLINVEKYPETDYLTNIIIDWMSICDYYELVLINYDINKKLSVKNTNIKSDIYGNTNSLLPIYFNKHHWKLYKTISSHHMSFINNIHESQYDKNYDNIYFVSLLKIFTYINFNIKRKQNEYIQLFIYILRTCIQIMQENKYNCSLEDKFEVFIDSLNENNYTKNISNIMIRTVQYIIFNGIKDLSKILKKITNMYVNNFIKTEINMAFWAYNSLKKKEYFESDFYKYINGWLCLKNDLLKLSYFTKKIYEYSGFNKFIKEIDKNDGFIEIDIENTNIINCLKLVEINNKINNEINFESSFNDIKINNFSDIYNKIDSTNTTIEKDFNGNWTDIRSNNKYKEKIDNENNIVDNEVWDEEDIL